MKLVGLFAGVLSTPALAKAAEPIDESSPVEPCSHCQMRNEMFLDPNVQMRMAVEEEELWDEFECWMHGHTDLHDQIIQRTKQRILHKTQQRIEAGRPTSGDSFPLLGRQVQVTYG
jgi:hypothetical protein